MLAQNWTKPLVNVALLMIAGASAVCCARAQQALSNGAIAGTLTDIRSAPLANMTVTLRNALTGAAVQTTTTRGGRYHFSGLPQGDYVLTATGLGGTGKVDGIFIAAGHEQHVQTAIALAPSAAGFTDNNTAASSQLRIQKQGSVQVASELKTSFAEPASSLSPPPSKSAASTPASATPRPSPVAFPHPVSRPLPASTSSVSEPLSLKPTFSASVAIAAKTFPAEAFSAGILARAVPVVKLGASQACLVNPRTGRPAQVAALQSASIPSSSQFLDATQLQALPLSGRNWQNFVLDAPEQGDEASETRSPSAAAHQIIVDGARMQLAFGSTNTTRNGASALLGTASTESAVSDVQPSSLGGPASAYAGSGRTIVETRRGTEHLHGQAFIFDRQHLWSARNTLHAMGARDSARHANYHSGFYTPAVHSQ